MKKLIKFGTSGWRAIIADEFTFENVKILSQSIADYIIEKHLEEDGIVVGYDTRFMTKTFAEVVSRVVAANGINVYLCNESTPTPVIAYEIIKNKRGGAVNITASHNPPEYSGIKFSPEWGGPALPQTTKWIEDRANYLLEESQKGVEVYKYDDLYNLLASEKIKYIDPKPLYFDRIRELIDIDEIKKAGLKVIYDPLYGTGLGYVDELLKECDVAVEVVNDIENPLFGGSTPEPSEENLSKNSGLLKKEKFDMIVSTDGDADRFGVVDKKGEYIQANYILALLLDYLIEERGWEGGVGRSVATSHFVDAVAKYHGIKTYETPVGFKYIGDLLTRGNIILGGEESSGLTIKGHVPEKDGILADLLIVEMVAKRGKSLVDMIDDLYDKVGKYYSARINFKLSGEEEKQKFVKFFDMEIKKFGGKKVSKVIRVDGTKLLFDDNSWVLFRMSGTEPVIRYYVEAHSLEELEELKNIGKQLIENG